MEYIYVLITVIVIVIVAFMSFGVENIRLKIKNDYGDLAQYLPGSLAKNAFR
jgi:predicted membrane chloride channel (bestrophin family)